MLHQPRGAGQAPRELVQGLAGPVRIGEAEGGEPLLGGTGGEDVLGGRARLVAGCPLGRAAREGLEERPEEQSFVDRPSRALVTGEDGVEAVAGCLPGPTPETEYPRQLVPRGAVGRHGVNLRLLDELEAVLDGAQESVRNRQGRRVLRRHVAGVGHLRQAGKGGPQAQRRILGRRAPVATAARRTPHPGSRRGPV